MVIYDTHGKVVTCCAVHYIVIHTAVWKRVSDFMHVFKKIACNKKACVLSLYTL